MNVFFDDLMTPDSFMNFEIGGRLDLENYTVGKDYDPIGTEGRGFYFFNSEIDLEVTTTEGLISSFDILLQNQDNLLFIGKKNALYFELNRCRLDELLTFLNDNKIRWKFDTILGDDCLCVSFFYALKFTLCFDFVPGSGTPLTIITLTKIPID